MAEFLFTATDESGKRSEGRIEAEDQLKAWDHLLCRGLYPLNLTEAENKQPAKREPPRGPLPRRDTQFRPLSINLLRRHARRVFQSRCIDRCKNYGQTRRARADLAVYTRMFAVLIRSGLSLSAALKTLAAQSDGKLASITGEILREVESGSSLAAALARRDGIFDRLFVGVVAAGECAGRLDDALAKTAERLEEEARFRAEIRTAVLAAAAAGLALAGAVFLLIAVVFPAGALSRGEAALPPLVGMAIAWGRFLRLYGPRLSAGISVIALAVICLRRSAAWQECLDYLKLRLPRLGPYHAGLIAARICWILSMLLSSGVPLANSLAITSGFLGNRAAAAALARAIRTAKTAPSLAGSLLAHRVVTPLAARLIAVGEEAGDLCRMLDEAARIHDEEARMILRRLIIIARPAIAAGFALVASIVAIWLIA